MGKHGKEAAARRGCLGNLNANARSLLVAMSFTLAVTVSQFFFAISTNSISLQADCISMGVDVMCYLASFITEMMSEKRSKLKRRLEVSVSLASLLVLLGASVFFLQEASENISTTLQIRMVRRATAALGADSGDPYGRTPLNPDGATGWTGSIQDLESMSAPNGRLTTQPFGYNGIKGGYSQYGGILPYNVSDAQAGCDPHSIDTCDQDDSPDGYVMLTFGLVGFLSDMITIIFTISQAATAKKAHAQATKEGKDPVDAPDLGVVMLSAFLHIGADLIRCLATITAATYIILKPGWASSGADDLSGLVVTVVIILGAFYGIFEWLRDVCQKKKAKPCTKFANSSNEVPSGELPIIEEV
mmetsp:Transcript_17187/g.30532  ORF Transcript_17187/g.30532 Transcript_17187/m.30532 type:complete len:359 (-) Transcript_17187:278-1354(-)